MATQRELDHQFRMQRLRVISIGFEQVGRVLCFLIFCTCVYLCARELAGRQTLADIRFKAIADFKANKWMGLFVPWGTATVATGWASAERYLRKRHIRRVSSETSEMQKSIDRDRRSSKLSKKGETQREDL
jgi:hypothetical protein